MKKIVLLALSLVLAFSAVAMAADVKVGGEVRYYYTIFGDDKQDTTINTDSVQYRVKVSAALNDSTSALVYLRSKPASTTFSDLLSAELTTKLAGIGTLAAGYVPDYGTSPFAVYGSVWGATGDKSEGFSFASEKFNGFAGQIFVAPKANDKADTQDTFVGGEVTYDLPVLEGSFVGVSANKVGDKDAAWAIIGSAPVGPATIYGEVGKSGDVGDIDVKTLGATVKVADLTLYGETDLQAEKNYLQVTYPFQGLSLNASYQFGDGYKMTSSVDDAGNPVYSNDGANGRIDLWVKASF